MRVLIDPVEIRETVRRLGLIKPIAAIDPNKKTRKGRPYIGTYPDGREVEFASLKEAALNIGVDSASICIARKYGWSSGGLRWRYASDPTWDCRCRAVMATYGDGRVVKYESMAMAAKATGANICHIGECVCGKRRRVKNIAWRYAQ